MAIEEETFAQTEQHITVHHFRIQEHQDYINGAEPIGKWLKRGSKAAVIGMFGLIGYGVYKRHIGGFTGVVSSAIALGVAGRLWQEGDRMLNDAEAHKIYLQHEIRQLENETGQQGSIPVE